MQAANQGRRDGGNGTPSKANADDAKRNSEQAPCSGRGITVAGAGVATSVVAVAGVARLRSERHHLPRGVRRERGLATGQLVSVATHSSAALVGGCDCGPLRPRVVLRLGPRRTGGFAAPIEHRHRVPIVPRVRLSASEVMERVGGGTQQ